jgi:hypothetical protein
MMEDVLVKLNLGLLWQKGALNKKMALFTRTLGLKLRQSFEIFAEDLSPLEYSLKIQVLLDIR